MISQSCHAKNFGVRDLRQANLPYHEIVPDRPSPSKDDDLIFSLQRQLALQTELCQQYENDLRSRDELVEILSKKLGDVENEDAKRKSVLGIWKKKVQELEDLVRQQATFELESRSSTDKMNALKEEVERQWRRIQVLQQESADKEVKLVQLNKQHQRDKEDLEGMNTALDSKQMELELLKRKLGIRGTAGATPAPASRVTNSRRDSAIFSAPTVSHPPSSA
ncbi:hypothetical protein C0993_001311 [Termitomyces sp. T159_Od127]|nr:hypothetical protein C0993_001311 [Termitomyces sp. T159_Od127]